ncbi:MAG: hypothetical protein ACE5OP_10055 [Candidatus Glassbacteria bacterium]
MSYCPECGLDFEEGMATCPECHVELVEVFPEADQRDPFRDFTTVFLCYSMDDAILVRSFLEEYNIPCLLSNIDEDSRRMKMGKVGEIRIMVPNSEEENASLLIEEALLDGGLQSISGELLV